MPALTVEKPAVRSLPTLVRPVLKAIRRPLRMPTWAVAAAVVIFSVVAFAAGRQKPAHRYVPYFGYPLVLDTTTGKACYATPPPRSEMQDAAFAIQGIVPADGQAPSGPTIPMCK